MKTALEFLREASGSIRLDENHLVKVIEDFAAQSVREYKEKLKNEVMSMRMNRHPVTAQVTIQVVVELIDSIDFPSPPTNKG